MADRGFDPTLKDLVEAGPADWPVLLGQPPAPTTVIDADIATVSGAGDKALRVAAAPPYLVHLEFQTGHDTAALPGKLHLRSTLLEHRHGLLVRTAAILPRPAADSPVLNGLRELGFPGEVAYDTFRYQVLRVWQLPPDVFLRGGPGTLPLAPISAVTEAELPGIIREMERRLTSRAWRRRAPKLWSAAFILMGLRWPRELSEALLRGVRSMKESVTYQAILEEGEAKGLEKGKAEGALAEIKKMLRRVGEDHLGVPNAATAQALEQLNDLPRLEEMLVRVPHVHSWQELLGRPAPRRRNGRRPAR
jgi:predicted transposase YdaD